MALDMKNPQPHKSTISCTSAAHFSSPAADIAAGCPHQKGCVQALEALRKLRTEKMAEVKEFRLRLDPLRTHKDTASRLRKDVDGGERQETELSNSIQDIDGKLAEINQVGCSGPAPISTRQEAPAFFQIRHHVWRMPHRMYFSSGGDTSRPQSWQNVAVAVHSLWMQSARRCHCCDTGDGEDQRAASAGG